MGNHRCCCKKACRIRYDDFTRVPEETAADGINQLGSSIYSGALADWHVTGGKLIADVADSQINFHDGNKRIWHVGANITLPNVGDYLKLHYDGNEAVVERTGSGQYETTMAGTTWQNAVGGSDVQFSVMMFPRGRHGYYFDRFTTTPDADLVAANLFTLTGFGSSFVYVQKPGFTMIGLPAAMQDVGSGFNVWGFSGSAGVSIDDLDLIRSKRACFEMLHGCGSACWPTFLADTAIVTASGFSGTYLGVGGFDVCSRSFFNNTYVCDPDADTVGCNWVKPITYTGAVACDSRVEVSLLYVDDVNDKFQVQVNAPWSESYSWLTAELTREEICSGDTFDLTAQSGSPSGTLTVRFA